MASREIEWIELPVKFKGIWYSPDWGGFNIFLRDRFDTRYPPDRLKEKFDKRHEKYPYKEHEHAKPTWFSKEEFELAYGKVEKIVVNKETWFSDDFYHTPYDKDMLIFTEKFVVCMEEYDGFEGFVALPRDWKWLLRSKKGGV